MWELIFDMFIFIIIWSTILFIGEYVIKIKIFSWIVLYGVLCFLLTSYVTDKITNFFFF